MFLEDLIAETNESTVVHYQSGHHDRETALARLTANGVSAARAAKMLDTPVEPGLFDRYGTWPCTAFAVSNTDRLRPLFRCVVVGDHDTHRNSTGDEWGSAA